MSLCAFGVFAYQFDAYPETTPTGHYWALMFWDKIIITVALVIPSKRGNRGFHCRHPESSTLENARLFAADPIAIREA